PRARGAALSFRLMGIPVEIDLAFFLVIGVLGWVPSQPPMFSIIWLGVVFFSILWHELGHSIAFKAFGHDPQIRLWMLGGLAHSRTKRELGLGQNVVVALAGPFAMFLLGGAAWWTARALSPTIDYSLWNLLRQLVFVNIGWGLLNLLPMLPLDGGVVMRSLLAMVSPRRGVRIAHAVSVFIAAGTVAISVMNGLRFTAIIALMLGATNLSALRKPEPALAGTRS
ncbi:MAG: site-2 protease family protein, partial [Actinomycetota bacterium]